MLGAQGVGVGGCVCQFGEPGQVSCLHSFDKYLLHQTQHKELFIKLPFTLYPYINDIDYWDCFFVLHYETHQPV